MANGINATTGSLGHGLPIAVGRALGRKKSGLKGKVYVMISDGECQEGTTWESLLIANHHSLANLVVIVDDNGIQALSHTEEVLSLGCLPSKLKAFGLNTYVVEDGHDYLELENAFNLARSSGSPTAIICKTIKGKGVTEFENDPMWHAKKVKGRDIEIGKKRLDK